MTYRIVTISNRFPQEWYYLQAQFYQSIPNDYNPLTINYGNWGGLASKPKWLYKAIKEGLVNTTHIIFADSWDLVFAAPPTEIIERFYSFNVPIVVSSEKNCFPGDLKDEYDKTQKVTPYHYLNSGFIVGETEAILTCLEAMDLPNLPDDYFDGEKNVHPNDQFEWQKIFLKQPVTIALDYYQILSQTLHEAKIEEFGFSDKRIRNALTNSYPCSFHFNGGSKDNISLRDPILKHLNLL